MVTISSIIVEKAPQNVQNSEDIVKEVTEQTEKTPDRASDGPSEESTQVVPSSSADCFGG